MSSASPIAIGPRSDLPLRLALIRVPRRTASGAASEDSRQPKAQKPTTSEPANSALDRLPSDRRAPMPSVKDTTSPA